MLNTPIYSLDERRKVAIPGNLGNTLDFCVDHFISSAKNSIKKKGSFFVALSGGSTPKAIFERLPAKKEMIDWSKVYIFWSDERSVPATNSDSNYQMAMTSGLQKLPIPPSHIFRMPADEDIHKGALAYEKKIKDVLKDESFDLVMLGMGEDGHTASLFPETEGLKESKRSVIANHIPQKDTWRMTMTFPLINHSKQAVFYVMGDNKKEMLDKVFFGTSLSFPCQRIGTKEHPCLWIIDDKAASLIREKLFSRSK